MGHTEPREQQTGLQTQVPGPKPLCDLPPEHTLSYHRAFGGRVSLPAVPIFPDVRTQSFRSF